MRILHNIDKEVISIEDICSAVDCFIYEHKAFPDAVYVPNNAMSDLSRITPAANLIILNDSKHHVHILTPAGVLPIKLFKKNIYDFNDARFVIVVNEELDKAIEKEVLGVK